MSEQFREHLFSYSFEGKEWGFSVMAADAADAQRRLRALAWAKYDGEVVARIPAIAGAGWLVRAVTFMRNLVWRDASKGEKR